MKHIKKIITWSSICLGMTLSQVLILSSGDNAYAHSGNTGKDGCHQDGAPGKKHCHGSGQQTNDSNGTRTSSVASDQFTSSGSSIAAIKDPEFCGLPSEQWYELANRGPSIDRVVVKKKNCFLDIRVHR